MIPMLFDCLKANTASIGKKNKVLHVGCGNSILGEELWKQGFGEIVNIDYSGAVIATMNKRTEKVLQQLQQQQEDHQKSPLNPSDLQYLEMDATDLKFESDSFDVVIEKGTFDSLSCNQGSEGLIAGMVKEIARVLRPNGVFIMISYGTPENRLFHVAFQQTSTSLKHESNQVLEGEGNGPGDHQYFYVFRKVATTTEEQQQQ